MDGIVTERIGDVLQVRDRRFQWNQATVAVLVLVYEATWLLSWRDRVVGATILAALAAFDLYVLYRAVHAGVLRLSPAGADLVEMGNRRHLDLAELDGFSTELAPRGREHLTIRVRGYAAAGVVRSITGSRRAATAGTSQVRLAAQRLNDLLGELRASGPTSAASS